MSFEEGGGKTNCVIVVGLVAAISGARRCELAALEYEGTVGEYNGEYEGAVGEYEGAVGEYEGEVGEYEGRVGEYEGELGEYEGELGEYGLAAADRRFVDVEFE